MVSVGVYARISDDKADDAKGVERQRLDARSLARLKGWTVTAEFVDNDVSAFKRNVVRPQFEAMLTALTTGAVDGIVAYDLDRLARQPRDLERLIDAFETRPGTVMATLSGDIDLSSPDGRTMARVMVAFANKSSTDTARRVARKHREIQEEGRPGGGPRPFGFKADRITHEPAEAAAIREGVAILIAGGSLATVAHRWNEAGILSTRGNRWVTTTVKGMLRNPRIAGQRARWTGKGWEPVLKDGLPVAAVWEPIVSPEEWAQAQAAVSARKTSNGNREGAVKFLLSGIVRCGACGAAMFIAQTTRERGNPVYACRTPANGGCGKVARVAHRVDGIVETATLTALAADLSGSQVEPEGWDGQVRLDRLEAFLTELTQAWKDGLLPAPEYFTERAKVDAEVKALKGEQRAHARVVAEHQEAVDVARQWAKATLQEKRAAVRATWHAIIIHPLPVGPDGRKIRTWNPELIELL